MLKFLIALILLAIVVSLFSGLVFLVKDKQDSKRTVNALTIRVALAVLLIVVLVIAALSGQLNFNASPINAF